MLNLGALQFTMGVDTRALDAARERITSFGAAVQQTQLQASRGIETNIQALRKQENAVLSGLEKLKASINSVKNSDLTPQVKADQIIALNRHYNELTKNIGRAGQAVSATKFDRSVAAFNAQLNDANRNISNMSAAARKAASDVAKIDGAKQAEAAATAQARFNSFLGITSQSASKSARESASVFTAAATGATRAERAILRQENAYARALEKARALTAQIETSNLPTPQKTQLTDRIDASLGTTRKAFTGGGDPLDARQFARTSNAYTADINKVKRSFVGLKKEMTAPKGIENWQIWRNNLKGLGSAALLANGHLGGMSTRVLALSSITAQFGIITAVAAGAVTGIGLAVVGVGRGAINAALQIEKAEKAMAALTGSTAAAKVELEFVRQVSDQAGIAFEASSKGYARYLAAANTSGQVLSETRKQFQLVALAAGTLSLSADDTTGVIRALEQIMSKGTVQAEELRGQLGDRFPGAFGIAAKAIGVTTDQLNKMLKAGEVISADFIPAFTEALAQEFNIDVGKDIDTLQASLERATNAITFFFLSFSEATGVTLLFKGAVNLFSETLNFLADNMNAIIETSAGVTGALLGVVAALTALKAVAIATASYGAIVAWMTSIIGLARIAKSATDLWTIAQIALNFAMATNPIGAVIGLIVKIAFVIGSAIVGYNLLTNAVGGSNAAFSDTSEIDAYIAAQNRATTATQATTIALREQIAVKGRVAQAEVAAAIAERNRITSKPQSTSIFKGVAILENSFQDADVKRATAEVDKKIAESRKLAKTFDELSKVEVRQNNLPRPAGVSSVGGGGTGKTPKSPKSSEPKVEKPDISFIVDSLAALQLVKDQMDVISEGPSAVEFVKTFTDVEKALADLDTKELSLADEALIKAGFSAGTLAERLAAVKTATEKNSKELAAFDSAWDLILDKKEDLSDIQGILELFNKGGSGEDINQFKSLQEAGKALEDLKGNSTALEVLRKALADIGFEGVTTEEALAKLFRTIDASEAELSNLENAKDTIADLRLETEAAWRIQAAYNSSIEEGLRAERWEERTRAIQSFGASFGDVATWTDEARQAVLDYTAAWDNNTSAVDSLEGTRDAAIAFQREWQNASRNVVDNIVDISLGLQSLEDAAIDVFQNIYKSILSTLLDDLFQDLISSLLGTNKANEDEETAAKIANAAATTAATAATIALTTSATAASVALAAIAAGGTGEDGGGGTTGGLIGLGANILTSILGGGSSEGSSSVAGNRAMGGRVTRGLSYGINEPGTDREVFIPGADGTITTLAALGGGGGTITIDARTTIDARGATAENIETLRAEMKRRDASLEQRLPYMVDARVRESNARGRN